jgi:hypothetical protein
MRLTKKYKVSMAVSRLVTIAQKTSYTALETIILHLQPLDPVNTALIDGNFSKSYMAWGDINANIDIGDKGIIATGAFAGTYFVKEIRKYAIGRLQHKEILITQKDA